MKLLDFANVLYNLYFQLCYNHHHDTCTQNILQHVQFIIMYFLLDPSYESALKVLTSDKMANTLWSTPSTELNEVQRKAIRKALKYRFQLIQGPPGQCFNIYEKGSK